jgi:hypothetical protein
LVFGSGKPGFAPLFACQFFAAFNDNLLKAALVFLIPVPLRQRRRGSANHIGQRDFRRPLFLPLSARR